MNPAELAADPLFTAAALLLIGAAASGVSLYATLAALGLASRLNHIPALPPGLTGLENGLVVSTAAILLLVEALADREPAFAGMWHSLHALVKPVAAALLSVSAVAGANPRDLAAVALAAALIALVFHAIRYGARVARRMPNAPRGSALWTAAEALLAVAILLPLRFQQAALPTAAGLLILMLIAGPLGVRAFRLGVSAQRARLRAFLGEGGWSGIEALPRRLRAALAPTPFAGSPPRAARTGVMRAPGIGRFQVGWLVTDAQGHWLLARTWRGTRRVALTGYLPVELEPGTWADGLAMGPEAGKLRLLLLKDGPAPPLVVRALTAEPTAGSRVDG